MTVATGSMCTSEPVISITNIIDVIGAFTEAVSVPAIAKTANVAISCGLIGAIRAKILPATAPTVKIGKKMPPGAPLPSTLRRAIGRPGRRGEPALDARLARPARGVPTSLH